MTMLSGVPSSMGASVPIDTHIDRLLDEAIRTVNGWTSAWQPACDLFEDEQGVTLRMAVPGYDPSQIEVQVEDGVVQVKGERTGDEAEGRCWYQREIPHGSFVCSFRLPASVDHGQSTAFYKHGTLTITFPKREEAKPRKIMIAAQ